MYGHFIGNENYALENYEFAIICHPIWLETNVKNYFYCLFQGHSCKLNCDNAFGLLLLMVSFSNMLWNKIQKWWKMQMNLNRILVKALAHMSIKQTLICASFIDGQRRLHVASPALALSCCKSIMSLINQQPYLKIDKKKIFFGFVVRLLLYTHYQLADLPLLHIFIYFLLYFFFL